MTPTEASRRHHGNGNGVPIRSRLKLSALIFTSALAITAVSGCSSPTTETSAAAEQETVTVSIPKSEVGAQATWIISQVNAKSKVDAGELESRMDKVLLDSITAQKLADVLDGQQSGREWIPTDVREATLDGDPCIFVRLKSKSTNGVTILQVVQSTETKLINGIHFLPAGAIDFGAEN